ncbi:sulfatase-like hydrolase/transferase [Pelagicoccus sp. SDUM812005]|uniref:sulfatase-like hydrolase/transferase n=1 Tax=Pelagicoccus sp. SDUM812005 TaxID=3041257 RepID=UPI00280E5DC0|nr:sulfatase-like hydrolase/transferase [Pelagicoccus sp. SDUM812005]MDQ8183174.1 sulfatase-like hydrolase/transferase [Pelagicoccus sp. SDUM812005]
MKKLILIFVFTIAIQQLLAAGGRPNIIFILSDDQGYGDISSHGAADMKTPRLDAFAAEGVRFDDFHSAPVCSPTRASLMTGKQFLRAGVWGVHGGRDYLDLSEKTVAEVLRESGYATAMLGKWHLGKTDAYLPYNRGFDATWSITDRLYEHTDPVIDHNGTELRPKGWTAEYLTDRAIDWISENKEGPFFLYLAHPYPHEPYYAPQSLVDGYKARGLSESYARLCAMVEHLDREVGRLLDAIDAMGLRDNTLIWFMGDNGPIGNPMNVPHLSDEEMRRRNPSGLKGMKGNLYEGGHRVPSFVRFGDRFPARRDGLEGDVTDIVPTLLDIAGVAPEGLDPDGTSIVDRLYGKHHYEPKLRVYANHEAIWPKRTRLYDYLQDKQVMAFEEQVLSARLGDYKWVQGYGREELYQVVDDPQELRNLAASEPERAHDIKKSLEEWWTEKVLKNPASYALPVYPLPRDAGRSLRLHGCAPAAIHGSLRQGSHYSHDWSGVGAGIDWAVQVPAAGVYEMAVSLECADGVALDLLMDGKHVATSQARAGSLEFGTHQVAPDVTRIGLRLSAAGVGVDEQIATLRWLVASRR